MPEGLFADWSPAELEACRQRVAVEAPYELRRHPEPTRLAWLAAYAHLRGRTVTDALVELLIETVHAIGARGPQSWATQIRCEGWAKIRQQSGPEFVDTATAPSTGWRRNCWTTSSASAASKDCCTGSPARPSRTRTAPCAT